MQEISPNYPALIGHMVMQRDWHMLKMHGKVYLFCVLLLIDSATLIHNDEHLT